ncbi:hypothetical protein BH23ACT11_BH23ACT11_14990 [soil metagenome]
MSRVSPQILLVVLVGAVPLAVLGAGVVAFLLLRAGYSVFVWAVVPFLGVLVVVALLGLVLGRAASGRAKNGRTGPRNRKSG